MGAVLSNADPAVRGNILIPKFIKGAEDALSVRRIIWANLKMEDRIMYGEGGDGFHWIWEKARAAAETNDGTQTVTPQIQDRFGRSNLDIDGFIVSDRMTKREKVKLQDSQARQVNYWKEAADRLIRDLDAQTNNQFFIDGPANPGNWNGFRSFTAYTQTIDYSDTSTTTARTANVADPFAYPDDTYAGNDTDLGAQGGSAGTGDHGWPFVLATEEFYAWTPIIVRGLSSYFGGTTWSANAVKAIRRGLMANKKHQKYGSKGYANWLLTSDEMAFDLQNLMDTKERVLVSSAIRNPYYGWEDQQEMLRLDGCKCTWEADVPEGKAFGFNFKHVTMRCSQEQLFVLDMDSPKWNGETRSWTWIADCLGQLQFDTPRNFFMVDTDYTN